MDAKTKEIEVHVMIDADGDYVCHEDVTELGTLYSETVNEATPPVSRTITVRLTVPLPRPVVLTGTVPPESSDGATLTVVGGERD